MRAYLADINDGFNEIINGMALSSSSVSRRDLANVWVRPVFTLYGEDANPAPRRFSAASVLSLFSSLILCGLLMLFGFSPAAPLKWACCMRLSAILGDLRTINRTDHATGDAATGCCCCERVFELMDGPRQQYGNDERRYRVAPSKSITCHLLIAMTIGAKEH